MATNLVSNIMDFVTPDIVAKIAAYFGLDRNSTQKAIGASIPTLLAGLVGFSSKPDGARQLSSVLSQQPAGVLDNLRSLTSGSEQKTLIENGSSQLSSLFSGSTFNGVVGAVGKFAGIGEGTSKSLLGLLSPLVLGGVAQHQRQAGLDAGGLSNFLASQKENISAAMPSGFSNMLGGTGLLDSISDTWRGGAASASAAANRFAASSGEAISDAHRAASRATREASRSASTGWLPWAIGLVALAGLAWWLTNQTGQQVVDQTRAPATQLAQAPQNLMVGGVNVVNQAAAAISGMKSTLQGISDTNSAQAAVPRLREAAAQLDNLSGLATQLPSSGRVALASHVTSEMPALDRDFNTVMSRPEIAAVLGPEINGLRTKLNALSRG